MQPEALVQQVCELAKEVGAWIKQERKSLHAINIEAKGKNDFVTSVDKEAESRIVQQLSKILPEAGFIAEEGSGQPSNELNWVIDPLDGTTNFIHGIPCYAISIALVESGDIMLGVVYEINSDECFYAVKDGQAQLNGNKITVSTTPKLQDSLLATGFPYNSQEQFDTYMELFRYFVKHARGIRRIGSAATDLAYVACGRFDGFYELGLHAWDVAAGVLIVRQAGGRVTDFTNGNDFLFGKTIIAGNNTVHQEMSTAVARFFGE